MQELFKEKHYKDLDGGILEGFGRLLKFDLRIYVYPTLDSKTGKVITAENVQVCRPLSWHSGMHKEALHSFSVHIPGASC